MGRVRRSAKDEPPPSDRPTRPDRLTGADWTVDHFLEKYDEQDIVLQKAGFPPTSPWWRAQIERFFRSGKRSFTLRVGRRGGKSSTLCRVGVCWALHGAYKVPPGDIGVLAFVSVSKEESGSRLRTIAAILNALGIFDGDGYKRLADSLEFTGDGLPTVVFKTFAASVKGVSGFTAVFIMGDELAKWRDSDSGVNPAGAVVSSLRPTVATQPRAPSFWVSSLWKGDDYHARLVALGDTDTQLVAEAPTWETNPTITEADTHELEPDFDIWQREYAAKQSAIASDGFFGAAMSTAVRSIVPEACEPGIKPIIVLDCDLSANRFAWSVTATRILEGVRHTDILEVAFVKPDKSPSGMLEWFRDKVLARHGTTRIYATEESAGIREIAKAAGVTVEIVGWRAGVGDMSMAVRARAIRFAMLEGTFALRSSPQVEAELRGVKSVETTYGNERVDVGEGHLIRALILGGSIALDSIARKPDESREPKTEQARMREAHIKEMERQKNSEWLRNPQRTLRRSLGMA